NRERELCDHERATNSPRRDSTRYASSAVLARGTQVAAQRCDRRRQTHQNSREQRNRQRPAEHAGIEGDFIQSRQRTWTERADDTNTDPGEQRAKQSRDRGEQDAFGEQLSHDPASTCAKRGTKGHLTTASDAAREGEACDVGRSNQKYERDGAAKHPE